jgi:YhhN family
VPAAIGAALFLVSDLILAATLFSGKTFPLSGGLVWLTYRPAQALIVTSALVFRLV